MSNRSLLEINHDCAGYIENDPEAFAAIILAYLCSGQVNPYMERKLRRFGVTVHGMRHHSDGPWADVLAKGMADRS